MNLLQVPLLSHAETKLTPMDRTTIEVAIKLNPDIALWARSKGYKSPWIEVSYFAGGILNHGNFEFSIQSESPSLPNLGSTSAQS